MHGDKERILQV